MSTPVSIFVYYLVRSITFTPELLIADLIFWIPFERKRFFGARFLISALIMLFSSAVIFYLTRNSFLSHILSFAYTLGFSLVMAKFCFQISWSDAAFCATAGYSVQFLGSIISEFIQRAFGFNRWPLEFLIVPAVYVAMYLLYGRRVKKEQNLDINKLFLYFLLLAAALTDIVICGLLRPYWMESQNRLFMVCSMILLFLCAFTILALQFSLLGRKKLENELEIVNQLLKKEQAQYQLSKETIDLINRKCHDMRHQIRTIGSQERINPEAISEMTKAIDIYDRMYKTGNQALDTILVEKALYCQENKISVNCMADGKKLGFMSDTDIYSLFGNILENAINAVTELPENDRDIFLSVVSRGELLSINARNPYSGVITIRDGLPVTKNADTANHGIGTRSIQTIVHKYEGTVSFDEKSGIFNVNILFPMKAFDKQAF